MASAILAWPHQDQDQAKGLCFLAQGLQSLSSFMCKNSYQLRSSSAKRGLEESGSQKASERHQTPPSPQKGRPQIVGLDVGGHSRASFVS